MDEGFPYILARQTIFTKIIVWHENVRISLHLRVKAKKVLEKVSYVPPHVHTFHNGQALRLAWECKLYEAVAKITL